MVIVTSAEKEKLRRQAGAIARRPDAWYAGFAVYATCVAVFSGPGLDHWWGTWAACGYAVAATVAAAYRTRAGQLAALAAAVAGALVAPLTWLATREPATADVTVVTRSGVLLLHHGTPYLPAAQLAHGGWLAYNPYLPVMAVFGLPKALGLPGILGDPRPWLAVATFLLLFATFQITTKARAAELRAGTGRSAALTLAAVAVASPVMALPLALGITDPPVMALTCLTLALLTRRRAGWQAAVVLGVVCAMKYTAWPALAVLVVMVRARDGARAAVRFGAVTLGTAIALAAALAPAALSSPAALIQNTVAYPLGLTAARSPAQSPLPGHLLATLGPAGHSAALILLVLAGVALTVSLITAPPATPARAAIRIALGLTALFALSPATRFGYLCYPLALIGWVALTGAGRQTTPPARFAADARPAPRSPAPSDRPLAGVGLSGLGRPLEGGERLRDPAARGFETVAQLRRGVGAEPVREPLHAAGQHLPGLGHQRAAGCRRERVAPPRPGAADHERELLAGGGRHHLGPRLPGVPAREFVPAGEPRARRWPGTLVPPAGLAHRAPLAHPRDVRDHVVQVGGGAGDDNRVRVRQGCLHGRLVSQHKCGSG